MVINICKNAFVIIIFYFIEICHITDIPIFVSFSEIDTFFSKTEFLSRN